MKKQNYYQNYKLIVNLKVPTLIAIGDITNALHNWQIVMETFNCSKNWIIFANEETNNNFFIEK